MFEFPFICILNKVHAFQLILLLSSSVFKAIERPDKNMVSLKRNQRQKAANREPQTYRDGMSAFVFLILYSGCFAQRFLWFIYLFFPFLSANGAVQGCRAGNKNKSILKRRLGASSESRSSSERKGGNGTVANGNKPQLSVTNGKYFCYESLTAKISSWKWCVQQPCLDFSFSPEYDRHAKYAGGSIWKWSGISLSSDKEKEGW